MPSRTRFSIGSGCWKEFELGSHAVSLRLMFLLSTGSKHPLCPSEEPKSQEILGDLLCYAQLRITQKTGRKNVDWDTNFFLFCGLGDSLRLCLGMTHGFSLWSWPHGVVTATILVPASNHCGDNPWLLSVCCFLMGTDHSTATTWNFFSIYMFMKSEELNLSLKMHSSTARYCQLCLRSVLWWTGLSIPLPWVVKSVIRNLGEWLAGPTSKYWKPQSNVAHNWNHINFRYEKWSFWHLIFITKMVTRMENVTRIIHLCLVFCTIII